ncbi:MAG TPA: glutamine amidotransferase [Paucimonas sp.]|nr:glutamine amidotransferase [Paucimonas sp.]HJW55173.1 glutamine amidotransferase [Burkholderiaceae bacterium]
MVITNNMEPQHAQGRTAAVIRHVPFEDLGTLAQVLETRGYRISYHDAGVDDLAALKPANPDLLVVLGGPIGAYEEQHYPFLRDTLALLALRLAADAPTLGICLGAQLLARALGARVYPGPVKEIGWAPLTLTAEGRASPVRHLAGDNTSMLHWHGDTFDLPTGAVLLASTAHCTNQAFRHGRHALAFQCHPELDPARFEQWLIGHAHEIAATPGVIVEVLRSDTRRHGAVLAAAARRTFHDWLDTIG